MSVDPVTWYQLGVVLGPVLALAAGAIGFLFRRLHSVGTYAEQTAKASADHAHKQAEAAKEEAARAREHALDVERQLAAMNLHVAQNYASNQYLKDVETRIVAEVGKLRTFMEQTWAARSAPPQSPAE